MKSLEDIKKGIEYRINKVEQYMDLLQKQDDFKNHYWEQYAIHSELCALLEWIQEGKVK